MVQRVSEIMIEEKQLLTPRWETGCHMSPCFHCLVTWRFYFDETSSKCIICVTWKTLSAERR